jgi:NTP pyrophosphatase (non-canonical NTP hydrolase)
VDQVRDYQETAASLSIYQDAADMITDDPNAAWMLDMLYCAAGIAGEAGEIANQIKKVMRDDKGVPTEERKAKVAKELGDVMWYAAAICNEFGLDLGEVMVANADKLLERQAKGTLQGDGDER